MVDRDSKTVPEVGIQKNVHPRADYVVYMKVIKVLESDVNWFLASLR